jgi:hypothetical protein
LDVLRNNSVTRMLQCMSLSLAAGSTGHCNTARILISIASDPRDRRFADITARVLGEGMGPILGQQGIFIQQLDLSDF